MCARVCVCKRTLVCTACPDISEKCGHYDLLRERFLSQWFSFSVFSTFQGVFCWEQLHCVGGPCITRGTYQLKPLELYWAVGEAGSWPSVKDHSISRDHLHMCMKTFSWNLREVGIWELRVRGSVQVTQSCSNVKKSPKPFCADTSEFVWNDSK